MKPPMKTIFALEPSLEQKAPVPNGILIDFEMAEKKVYRQTNMFVYIIVENR